MTTGEGSVLGSVISVMAMLASHMIRSWRSDSSLARRQDEADAKQGKTDAMVAEVLEHVASINRKEWRRAHPGQVTPDPTQISLTVEPLTNPGFRRKP